eukprot:547000-Pyramimonas_sp.AAC.1
MGGQRPRPAGHPRRQKPHRPPRTSAGGPRGGARHAGAPRRARNLLRWVPAKGIGTRHCRIDREDLVKPSRHSREDSILPPILHGARVRALAPRTNPVSPVGDVARW